MSGQTNGTVSSSTRPFWRNFSKLFALPIVEFLIKYRRTALGPVWLLVGPSLFIVILGNLYSAISAIEAKDFIPHLSVGLVVWTLIQSLVNQSSTVFQRNRAQIMQSGQHLDEIIGVEVVTSFLTFLHQVPIIIAVMLIFGIPLHWAALESLFGLAFIIANGIWITRLFGILGARYRDLSEVFQAVMRIAFLATPIIWMPGAEGRGGVLGHFLTFNPFYHFLQVVRAPLLGQPVETISWLVVIAFTLFGYGIAHIFTKRYAHLVPLWI